MSNIAIEFENISKQYRLGTIGTGTLSHDLNRWWHQIRGKEDPYLKIGEVNDRSKKADSDYVWALKDISFKVEQGEVLGIIGKNGAGKSTLLKILSRITSPSTGTIKAKGRIASLLEVGTGFHQDLTGRENIYMNGAIMGMTRHEISSKLDEIVAFSGIEKYIDTPVKRYSSGMTVRLGFAVAAHLEPEILVVDEVLAVGDAEFQKKAIGKMKDVSQGGGRTVLFVSHQLNSVAALCNKCLLMADGKVDMYSDTDSVISKYLGTHKIDHFNNIWINSGGEFHFKNFTPLKMYFISTDMMFQSTFQNNMNIGVVIEGNVEELHHAFNLGFAIYNSLGALLYWSLDTDINCQLNIELGHNKVVMWMQPHILNEGEYRVELITSLHHIEWQCQPELKSPQAYFMIQGGLSDSAFWQEARPGILAPINKFSKI